MRFCLTVFISFLLASLACQKTFAQANHLAKEEARLAKLYKELMDFGQAGNDSLNFYDFF